MNRQPLMTETVCDRGWKWGWLGRVGAAHREGEQPERLDGWLRAEDLEIEEWSLAPTLVPD
jgi:hypothetical protein